MAIFNKIQRATIPEQDLLSGSSYFSFKIPSIVAGGTYSLDLSTQSTYSDIKIWLPVDYLNISANAGVDFEIQLNGMSNNVIIAKDGTINTIDNIPIRSVNIINLSSTTASTNEMLVLNFHKEAPNSDNVSKKIIKLVGF